ncbi:MAG: P-loop NTPase fold protein [Candidatus Nitrosoabyssus spongiisocia]|nr:MAG: P-loop NTPase fold protein [Nitrosopumilaceae archaeon AB1(1)]
MQPRRRAHYNNKRLNLKIDQILESMKLLSDQPGTTKDTFGSQEFAENICSHLLDQGAITPFTIAINAPWGMGKTTVLKMIRDEIKEKNQKQKLILFNPLEYEKMDVTISLFVKIKNEVGGEKDKNNKKLFNIVKLVTDVTLRNFLSISLEDLQKNFDDYAKNITDVETLTSQLEELIGDEKIIIFIDDLDRCSAENIIKILESIKLFTIVKNTIVVIAVDILRLERALELRYSSDLGKNEGREYLEKLFPLIIPLPEKSPTQIETFIFKLIPTFDQVYVDILVNILPYNPRKIKRMLNLVYVNLLTWADEGSSVEVINIKFLFNFRILCCWILLVSYHPDFAREIQRKPSNLITVSTLCNKCEIFENLKKLVFAFKPRREGMNTFKLQDIKILPEIMTHEVYELLLKIEKESELFKILSELANDFELEFNKDFPLEFNKSTRYNTITKYYRRITNILNNMV